MTATASCRDLRAILADLREYAALLGVYDLCARDRRRPPINTRVRLKQLEYSLPAPLGQYASYLHRHPRHPDYRPVTGLDRKNRCTQCGIAVHPEWVGSVARGEVLYVCARCAAVFTPLNS